MNFILEPPEGMQPCRLILDSGPPEQEQSTFVLLEACVCGHVLQKHRKQIPSTIWIFCKCYKGVQIYLTIINRANIHYM